MVRGDILNPNYQVLTINPTFNPPAHFQLGWTIQYIVCAWNKRAISVRNNKLYLYITPPYSLEYRIPVLYIMLAYFFIWTNTACSSLKGSGFIEASEFLTAYKSVFPTASPADAARVFSLFSHGSPVDYISWCQHLSLKQMPAMAESIHQAYGDRAEKGWLGDLSSCCLTIEEYQLVLSMKQRLDRIVQRVNSLSIFMNALMIRLTLLCHNALNTGIFASFKFTTRDPILDSIYAFILFYS